MDKEIPKLISDPNNYSHFKGAAAAQSWIDATCTNLHIVLPEPNELFIDIDSAEDYEEFWKNWSVLRQYEKGYVRYNVHSKSGLPNRHIIIELKRILSPYERVALQCALGSHRMRELLTVLDYMHHVKDPVFFFEVDD